MRSTLALLLGFLPGLALLCLGACSSTDRVSERGYGRMDLQWSADPTPLEANRPFDLHLRIDGPMVERLEVMAVHPSTQVRLLHTPPVHQVSADHWVAEDLLLHLPGTWEVELQLHYNGRVRPHTLSLEPSRSSGHPKR